LTEFFSKIRNDKFTLTGAVYSWLVWRSGNDVGCIKEVELHRARLVQGLVIDLWPVYHPAIYPGSLSLAIPPWIGALST